MLAFGVTTIFLLRDIGSGMIFTIIGTVLATEPALLNRQCFVGYLCSAFHIIGAYSAKIDICSRQHYGANSMLLAEVMCPSSDHRRFRTWCLSVSSSRVNEGRNLNLIYVHAWLRPYSCGA